jgi:cobalt ECF transporter T component CbiQ
MISLRDVAEHSLFSEGVARVPGVLQSLDARAKLGGLLALILAAVLSHELLVLAALLVLALSLAAITGRGAFPILFRAWLAGVALTGIAAAGALVLTPGEPIAQLPFGLAITRQGSLAFSFLLGRVLTATTLSLVLVLSTRWAELLRALRMVGMPAILIAIIAMTYRYLFVLLEIAAELFDGRRSRRVGSLPARVERRLAGATAGALLTRTLVLTEDVHQAMQSRGFRGDVHVLDQPRMGVRDWAALGAFVIVSVAAMVVGR